MKAMIISAALRPNRRDKKVAPRVRRNRARLLVFPQCATLLHRRNLRRRAQSAAEQSATFLVHSMRPLVNRRPRVAALRVRWNRARLLLFLQCVTGDREKPRPLKARFLGWVSSSAKIIQNGSRKHERESTFSSTSSLFNPCRMRSKATDFIERPPLLSLCKRFTTSSGFWLTYLRFMLIFSRDFLPSQLDLRVSCHVWLWVAQASLGAQEAQSKRLCTTQEERGKYFSGVCNPPKVLEKKVISELAHAF
jgi:hypothetical protein